MDDLPRPGGHARVRTWATPADELAAAGRARDTQRCRFPVWPSERAASAATPCHLARSGVGVPALLGCASDRGSTDPDHLAVGSRTLDFAHSPRAQELLERVRGFVADHIAPIEHDLLRDMQAQPQPWTIPPVVEELKDAARAEGLWNLFLPGEHGAGLTNVEYAPARRGDGPLPPRLRDLQLQRARHGQHGGAAALRLRGAAAPLARPAARGAHPVGLLHDRTRRRLLGRDQHGGHRGRRGRRGRAERDASGGAPGSGTPTARC